MSAPLAKGLIIAASVLVAAGIAMYENEQVRLWLDERRRRIAVALHNMGDGISPQQEQRHAMAFGAGASSRSPTEEMAEATDVPEDLAREHRRRVVMQNKRELLRRAKDDGVAVDLDVLAALSLEAELLEAVEYGVVGERSDAAKKRDSFDSIVGEDGKLRESNVGGGKGWEMKKKIDIPVVVGESSSAQAVENMEGLRRRNASPIYVPESAASAPGFENMEGLRRGNTSPIYVPESAASTRGFDAGAAWANPFDDEAQVLFDQSLIGPAEDELFAAPVTSPAISESAPPPAQWRPSAEPRGTIDIPIRDASWVPPRRPRLHQPALPERQSQWNDPAQYKTDEELDAEIERAIRISIAQAKEEDEEREAIRLSIVEAEKAEIMKAMADAQRDFQARSRTMDESYSQWGNLGLSTHLEEPPARLTADSEEYVRSMLRQPQEQTVKDEEMPDSANVLPASMAPRASLSPREEPLDESLYGMPSPKFSGMKSGLVPMSSPYSFGFNTVGGSPPQWGGSAGPSTRTVSEEPSQAVKEFHAKYPPMGESLVGRHVPSMGRNPFDFSAPSSRTVSQEPAQLAEKLDTQSTVVSASGRPVLEEPALPEEDPFILPSFPALKPVRADAMPVVSAHASSDSRSADGDEPMPPPLGAPSTITLVNAEQDVAQPETQDDVLSGAKTPTTEGGFSFTSAPSNAGSVIDVDDMMDVDDLRSEAEMSEFSIVSACTPSSWTDVETDEEIEEVGNGVRVVAAGTAGTAAGSASTTATRP